STASTLRDCSSFGCSATTERETGKGGGRNGERGRCEDDACVGHREERGDEEEPRGVCGAMDEGDDAHHPREDAIGNLLLRGRVDQNPGGALSKADQSAAGQGDPNRMGDREERVAREIRRPRDDRADGLAANGDANEDRPRRDRPEGICGGDEREGRGSAAQFGAYKLGG